MSERIPGERRPRTVQPTALALAAFAGASVWVSLGVLAVTGTRGARVGALPSLWTLLALVLAAVLAARLVRLRTEHAWPLSLTAWVWLPWVPIDLPPALLAWEGPLETLIWFAAVGGVIAGTWRWSVGWWHNPARAPWVLAAVFFACAVTSAAALHRQLPGGDEPHYLVITQSLLYDGDLQIENNHARGDFFEYTDAPLRPDFLQRGVNDQIYSVHAPGVSALLLPAYAVAGYPGAVVFVAALSALAVALLWRIAFVLSGDHIAAWMGATAVGFSATVFLHAFAIFPDPVGAAAVSVALWALVQLDTRVDRLPTGALVAASGCLSLLPWLHTRFVLVSVGFAVAIALRLLRWTRKASHADGEARIGADAGAASHGIRARLALIAAVPALAAVAWFASFYVIYGTPNPSAPYGNSRQNAVDWIATGLAGLAFDHQFGLAANAPVFAFLPVGLYALARVRGRLALELAAIAMPYVAVVASFGMWWGGWSAPARFLTCLMPLAVPVMASAWIRANRGMRLVFVALTLLGIGNIAARVIFEEGMLLYNTRDGFDLLLDWASRSVNLPLAMPSVHRLGTERTVLVALVWSIAVVIAALVVTVTVGGRQRPRASVWSLVMWTLLACGSAALTASWQIVRTRPVTPESSKIAFLQRWDSERRPLLVRLPSGGVVNAAAVFGDLQLRNSTRMRDRSGDPPPLLRLARVPPGEYAVVVTGARELKGELTVHLGDAPVPLHRWRLEEAPQMRLRLPLRAHSISIRGDAAALGSVQHLALLPSRLRAAYDTAERVALRAAGFGVGHLFFLDDGSYVEPGGIWTRGNATTEVVVTRDSGSPDVRNSAAAAGAESGSGSNGTIPVDLVAGPVAASVEWVGPAVERVDLRPGERRRITVPEGRWAVRTRGVFRPKDYDPGSRDGRPLGVRLEFP